MNSAKTTTADAIRRINGLRAAKIMDRLGITAKMENYDPYRGERLLAEIRGLDAALDILGV